MPIMLLLDRPELMLSLSHFQIDYFDCRAILDRFDARDGLRKLYNYVSYSLIISLIHFQIFKFLYGRLRRNKLKENIDVLCSP